LPAALGLAAALVWGGADFAGGLAARRTSALRVVAVAHGGSLLVLLALCAAAGLRFPGLGAALPGLAAGVAGGLGLVVFYRALAGGAMGVTAAAAGVVTAAVPVLYQVALRGAPSPRQTAGFLTAAAAIWLIARIPEEHPGRAAGRRSLLLGSLAGTGFGLLLILLNAGGRVAGVWWTLALARAASVAVCLLMLALARPPAAARRFLGLALAAGLLDAAGNLLFALAARQGRLDVAAVLSSLYPAATILLAALLLSERVSRIQLAGMALAVAAVVLITG
jgi:drug/metabolite transporter (DMT)-like permease